MEHLRQTAAKLEAASSAQAKRILGDARKMLGPVSRRDLVALAKKWDVPQFVGGHHRSKEELAEALMAELARVGERSLKGSIHEMWQNAGTADSDGATEPVVACPKRLRHSGPEDAESVATDPAAHSSVSKTSASSSGAAEPVTEGTGSTSQTRTTQRGRPKTSATAALACHDTTTPGMDDATPRVAPEPSQKKQRRAAATAASQSQESILKWTQRSSATGIPETAPVLLHEVVNIETAWAFVKQKAGMSFEIKADGITIDLRREIPAQQLA